MNKEVELNYSRKRLVVIRGVLVSGIVRNEWNHEDCNLVTERVSSIEHLLFTYLLITLSETQSASRKSGSGFEGVLF